MIRVAESFTARLDSVYSHRAYFTCLKARLLAAFMLLLLAWLPINVAKLLWTQPPHLPVRLAGCTASAAIAVWALHQLCKGRLELAGNGLGLASVARIVDLHGGTIRAEGQTGRGATFYLGLPVPA